MDNFNLRSFLSENTLTTNSRIISEEEINMETYYKCSSADEILREIEKDLKRTTFEVKLDRIREIIQAYENKVVTLEEDSELKGFVNSSKIKEMKRTLNNLRKTEEKLNKEYTTKYHKKK